MSSTVVWGSCCIRGTVTTNHSLCCPLPPLATGCVRVTEPPVPAHDWMKNYKFAIGLFLHLCSAACHSPPVIHGPLRPSPGGGGQGKPLALLYHVPVLVSSKERAVWIPSTHQKCSGPISSIFPAQNNFPFPNNIFKLLLLLSK